MESCPEEEAYEISYIPVTDTRAHPWAVVVVNFNAKPTNTAME